MNGDEGGGEADERGAANIEEPGDKKICIGNCNCS